MALRCAPWPWTCGGPIKRRPRCRQPRTLQRRLADESTGFQQVLEAVRREMAQHYLTGPSFDLNEIAYLLGYEEPSSFHRAFHHWERTSPGQWRAAQRYLTLTP